MKSSKLTKLLATFLALVLILSCAPNVPLSIFAEDWTGTAAEAATAVNALRYFTAEDLATYEAWETSLAADGNNATELARIQRAIAKLKGGLSVYDDLAYIGSYETTGQEPANAFEPFPTTTSDSTWQMVWGGLKSVNAQNKYSWTSTAPSTSTIALKFNPYHFTQYPNLLKENVTLSSWGFGAVPGSTDLKTTDWNISNMDSTEMLAGLNWATPTYVDGTKTIDVITGTFRSDARTAVIYDYIDARNFAYFTVVAASAGGTQSSYLTAVVVKDGRAIREIPLTLLISGGYGGQFGGRSFVGDFTMQWNKTEKCYALEIVWQESTVGESKPGSIGDEPKNVNKTVSVLLKNGTHMWTEAASWGHAQGDISQDILVHPHAQKLTKVYISGDGRNTRRYGSAPLTNLGVYYGNQCAHGTLEDSELVVASPADCQQNAAYYKLCTVCEQFVAETWEKPDTIVGHKLVYTSTGDAQHTVECAYGCGTVSDTQNHDYGPIEGDPQPGMNCIYCGFVYDLAGIQEIVSQLESLRYFRAEDIETYRSWKAVLDRVSTELQYEAVYARLSRALAVLESGMDVYDDLAYIGSYETTGQEPENAFEPFPTVTGDSTWQMVWGGLKSVNAISKYSWTSTAMSANVALKFNPYHFAQYPNMQGTNTTLSTWGFKETYENMAGLSWNIDNMDSTVMLAGLNWATPTYVDGTKTIDKITGTFNSNARTAVIYDYRNAQNFAYFTVAAANVGGNASSYLTAVVVEDGKAVREIPLVLLMGGGYGGQFGQRSFLGDFTMEWVENEGYKLTVTWKHKDSFVMTAGGTASDIVNSESLGTKTVMLNDAASKSVWTWGHAQGDSSQSILVHPWAQKLTKVYISGDARNTKAYGAAPLTNLSIDYGTQCAHANLENSELCEAVHANCVQNAVYYKLCKDCNQFVTETWEKEDSKLGHSMVYTAQGDAGHSAVCANGCGHAVASEAHNYALGGAELTPGRQCVYCGYIYDQSQLEAVKQQVEAVVLFELANLQTYDAWLSILSNVQEMEAYQSAYTRLSRAMKVLAEGYTYYDDLNNAGNYATGNSNEGMTRGDAFANTVENGKNTWQIVWGGLTGDSTVAYTMNNSLAFKPINFASYNGVSRDSWKHGGDGTHGLEMDKFGSGSWAAGINNNTDMTTLLGGLNWATPTYIDGTKDVEKVTGTVYARAWTSIIFDYQDSQNYSYLTMISGSGGNVFTYLTAVVVQNGKAVREIKLAQMGYSAGYQRNAFYAAEYQTLGDFVMEWDSEKACYKFTVQWSGISKVQVYEPGASVIEGTEGNKVTVWLNNDDSRTAYGHAEGDTSLNILNGTAQKLHNVYISADIRNCYGYGSAPITRLGVVLTDATHEHAYDQKVENTAHIAVAPDCTQYGVYYYSCTCGENGTETFAGTKLGGHTNNGQMAHDATHHWTYCSVCYTELVKEPHGSDPCETCKYSSAAVNFLPEILGGKVIANATPFQDQKLQLYVDFSKIANAQDITFLRYGYAVMWVPAGGVTKAELENLVKTAVKLNGSNVTVDENVTGVIVNEVTPALVENGQKFITVDVGAENYGMRVAMIAFLMDDHGNYYFSQNNGAEVLRGSLTNGMLQTGVMRVIKNIMVDTDTETGYATYIPEAITAYLASEDCREPIKNMGADNVQTMLTGYLNGTIGTNHADYVTAREICLWVFRYVDVVRQ